MCVCGEGGEGGVRCGPSRVGVTHVFSKGSGGKYFRLFRPRDNVLHSISHHSQQHFTFKKVKPFCVHGAHRPWAAFGLWATVCQPLIQEEGRAVLDRVS